MLKLKLYYSPDAESPLPEYVYISVKSIGWMQRWLKFTEVRSDGYSFRIVETPEQILAMDEMVYELHPAICVDAAGNISKVK
jgi:hypothetical protein